jgi:hypothetical protein
VSVPPPSATADSDANTTSVSMTTAVRFAGSRAAPYCSERLPARKTSVSAPVSASQGHAGAGGAAPRRSS